MRQIVDSSGNKLVGHFKKDDGSIVVLDVGGFNKQKKVSDTIKDMQSELIELRALVMSLIK
jgi:hypothetical protein